MQRRPEQEAHADFFALARAPKEVERGPQNAIQDTNWNQRSGGQGQLMLGDASGDFDGRAGEEQPPASAPGEDTGMDGVGVGAGLQPHMQPIPEAGDTDHALRNVHGRVVEEYLIASDESLARGQLESAGASMAFYNSSAHRRDPEQYRAETHQDSQ